jgi:hyperosmotically inducible protein
LECFILTGVRIMKTIICALLVIGLGGIVGCASRQGESSTAADSGTAAQPTTTKETQSSSSDAAITAAVKEALRKDELLGSLNIEVETYQGVVTLAGNVPDALAYNRAISIARGVGGVRPPVRATNLKYLR